MKAIIIAAGMGKRLGPHTEHCPKSLLKVGGQAILDYQIEALAANGVHDLVLIKGYQAEVFGYPQYRSYLNHNYQNNNILCSLMMAADEMDTALIASYSDILYDAPVVKALLSSPHDISLVVDTDWQKKYEGRTEHPESEAEKAVFNERQEVLSLGKILNLKSDDSPPGEFIGLFKLTERGAGIFKACFEEAKRLYDGKPFYNAPVFEKAYITDMMLYLIEQGVPVHAVPITEGWMEIDTPQDLERAERWQAGLKLEKTKEGVA